MIYLKIFNKNLLKSFLSFVCTMLCRPMSINLLLLSYTYTIECNKDCRFICELSRSIFLTYSKKILELCRTWRLGTINIMNDNILSKTSISLIKMTPKVKHYHLSTHRSVNLHCYSLGHRCAAEIARQTKTSMRTIRYNLTKIRKECSMEHRCGNG